MKSNTSRTIPDIRSIYNDYVLENTVSYLPGNRISEIESHVNSAPSNSKGIKLEARIEVTPKYRYRLKN
jgi:hypothetical protein